MSSATSEQQADQATQSQTCAVTVTYGSRLALVEQVVQGALACGAGHVVVVDNGTASAVATGLSALPAQFGAERVSVVRLPENMGSAGGFRAGVEAAAARPETGHIWLLDDDNLPVPDALTVLAKIWRLMGARPDVALVSFRPDKRTYQKLITRDKPNSLLPNSFFGFSVQSPWQKQTVAHWRQEGLACWSMDMAGYGGLWFHKDGLQKTGLPDARFYLYFDDYDFTLRMTEGGGQIWLCQHSTLTDLEPSWTEGKAILHPWLQPGNGLIRPYFSIRNRIILEKRAVHSRAIYRLNRTLFLLIKVFCATPRSVGYHLRHPVRMFRRWQLIRKAIRDGEAERFDNSLAHPASVRPPAG